MFKLVAMALVLALPAMAQQTQQDKQVIDKLYAAHAAPYITGAHKLTVADQQAVVQAILDEIYDYGYQREFYEIGVNTGTPDHWVNKIPIYIEPSQEPDGGRVIYRLMPYGEVSRLFGIRKDGVVVLTGDPENGFPVTQPSELTQYMDDDEICRMKRQWIRTSVLVDEEPSLNTVKAAADRQETRVGISVWKLKHASQKPPSKKRH